MRRDLVELDTYRTGHREHTVNALIACDVSEFQTAVTNAYPHRWLTFRACDGSYVDHHLDANLAWAVHARKTGKLDGFTVYVVYEPGRNDTILSILHAHNVPADCTVMIDVESWGGKINGNHSGEINALARALAKRQGSKQRVWGYANRGDYAAIWPKRPRWLGLVVASYGGSKPASPGPGPLVGWQYSNGQYDVPGLPNSSAPFGRCDHNQLYIDVQEDDMDISKFFRGADKKPHQVRTLVREELQPLLKLAADIDKRLAQVQAAQAKSGTVTVTPTDVPATLHIGSHQ